MESRSIHLRVLEVSVDAHCEKHLGSIQYYWIGVCETLADAQVCLTCSYLIYQRSDYLFNRGSVVHIANRATALFMRLG